MSDPIMQALRGEISWREADQLYHGAMADHAPDHEVRVECVACAELATDECEGCEAPICGDDSHHCEGCDRYVCEECIDTEDQASTVCHTCRGDQDEASAA